MNGFVLITGAAKRLGRVIALHLAASGWDIVVHYHTSRAEADELAQLIRALGRTVHVVQTDLMDNKAVEGLIPSLAAAKCRITGLINNASLFVSDIHDPEGLHHCAINYDAPVKLSALMAQNLPPDSTGCIVNLLDGTPIPNTFSAYRDSKEKLRDATIAMALDLAPYVRVNAIAPGPTMKNPRQSDDHFARMVAATPLGLETPPEAVAGAVRFLLENPVITGAILPIDGGAHLIAPTS